MLRYLDVEKNTHIHSVHIIHKADSTRRESFTCSPMHMDTILKAVTKVVAMTERKDVKNGILTCSQCSSH